MEEILKDVVSYLAAQTASCMVMKYILCGTLCIIAFHVVAELTALGAELA
nr:hypothetical protein Iba_chr12cCG21050 [Ipomoea batatas]